MKIIQKYTLIINIMLFSFLNATISEIREIKSFSEIDFDAITIDEIVVFDIDEVLIEPADVVGQHTSRRNVIQIFNEYVAEDDSEECISIMLRDMKKVVIEDEIIEKIKRLKEKGVIVIALTSCRIGKFGVIECYEQMRHAFLNECGFTWSFEDEICIFKHLKKDKRKNTPLFYKGMIIVEGYSKGKGLDAFLMWKRLSPSKIIFIDNHKPNLLAVQKTCETRDIPFIGYHYLRSTKVELDEEKMHKQFHHLSQHKTWLNDTAFSQKMDE